MSLAHDLLLQADVLTNLDPRRPKQASLRRALSTAYYAFFHLLAEEASQALAVKRVDGLAAALSRALNHSEMRKACYAVLARPLQPPLDRLLQQEASAELRLVAKRFVDLQEVRHIADYDVSAAFSKPQTLAQIRQTQAVFSTWTSLRSSDEAAVFLASLAFGARWGR